MKGEIESFGAVALRVSLSDVSLSGCLPPGTPCSRSTRRIARRAAVQKDALAHSVSGTSMRTRLSRVCSVSKACTPSKKIYLLKIYCD
jgi:hypothetical protein